MGEQNYLGGVGLTFLFFVPAIILLFFAWSVWSGNKPPTVSKWRLSTFKTGLVVAIAATAAFFPGAAHYTITQQRAEGIWLALNWTGAVLWLVCLAAGLMGKGSGRILLLFWGILLFVGIYGLDLASIP